MPDNPERSAPDPAFAISGELSTLMRTFDWSLTPLGSPENWPAVLRTLVTLILGAGQPMFVVWGPEHILLYNDACVGIMGPKHPAALGRPLLEVWSELRDDLEPVLARACTGEALPIDDNALVLHHIDSPDEMRFSCTPIRDDTGTLAGLFCVCPQTSGPVLTRHRLAAGTERQLFKQAPGFITILRGPEHVFEFVNDAYARLFGGRDFVGSTVRQVFPDIVGQGFYEWLDQVYATGKRFIAHDVPIRLRPMSDAAPEERFLDFIYEPVINANGQVTGIFVEGYDVTNAHRAREALQQLNDTLEARVADRTARLQASEARLRAIFETSYQYQGLMALDGTLLDANAASLEGIRARIGDVVGQPFWETPWFTGTPGMPEAVRAAIPRVVAGETVRREIVVNLPTGQRAFDFSMRPIRDETGRVIAIVPEAAELTERRRAEEQFRQAQKMEAIGQLTGGVAHDFNNLLTIIRSATDFLRRPDLTADRRQRYLNAITETVDRATKLTGQLLAFARRQPLKPEVFDVAGQVRGVADMLRTIVGGRIRIVTDLTDEHFLIEADISQFETALVNMAVNARDAMNGEGVLTLRIRSVSGLSAHRRHRHEADRFVAISLNDTGTGIAPDKLEHIFEPFFTTKEIGQGTGLGLSQVYGFVKQSGGDVVVDSDPNRGATFTLYLPRVEHEAADTIPADAPGALPPEDGRGCRVLVVEDNVEVGIFSTQLLQDLGYQATWAASANEALNLLGQQHNFDAVFSDVVMPGMGGVELGREIRRRYPGLPVVLASGYSHVLIAEGRHGFALVRKPYTVEELSRVLRQAIQEHPGTS
ncbi:hypothetical protein SAE02_75310 [Skermanella aerolata]|uniref:histidine kinase n=1 Tax=Skermanella aerolata TaxID=393310 RepID=A0A512E3S6_9PROT|nr:PAS domain-containing protein [Skermanella aerolata]KJB90234.1 hypothetical protein N826_04490 [Skermanella aerolata KACC 11604]GEO43383.1 hypothetical protein SAE02_75310 [Skermanella aerolata]